MHLVVCANQSHHMLLDNGNLAMLVLDGCSFKFNKFRTPQEIEAKLEDGWTICSGPSFARYGIITSDYLYECDQ